MMSTDRKEAWGGRLLGVSIVIAACQCVCLLMVLVVPFSGDLASDTRKFVYILGEISCLLFGVPAAITGLALSRDFKTGRAVLAFSVGVAALCGVFMFLRG